MERSRAATFTLTLIVTILVIVALFAPWWSVGTSTEVKQILNSEVKTEYGLFHTVTAAIALGNDTRIVTVPVENLTEVQKNAELLSFSLNVTLALTVAGLVAATLLMIMVGLSKFGKSFYRYERLIGIISAILLFSSSAFMAVEMPYAILNLSKLTPVEVPSTWISFSPTDINGFWGAIKASKNTNFPSWAQGLDFWTWRAAYGWYCTFTAALLMTITLLLIHYTITEESIEQTSSLKAYVGKS